MLRMIRPRTGGCARLSIDGTRCRTLVYNPASSSLCFSLCIAIQTASSTYFDIADTMDTEKESFFIDAISDEVPDDVAQHLAGNGLEDLHESRDTTRSHLTDILDTTAEAGSSEVIPASGQSSDQAQDLSGPPKAILIFAIGEHRFSGSCELGVLNEHPEAFKDDHFKSKPDYIGLSQPRLVCGNGRAAAVDDSAASRPTYPLSHCDSLPRYCRINILHPSYEGPGKDEQQKLAETVRHELGQAVPYYEWQGSRNCHGRVQYLMALLEEAIRVLAVPKKSLTKALTQDVPAAHALQRVVQSILDLGERPADVCGVWAAETLLSAWASDKACQPPRCLTPASSNADDKGREAGGFSRFRV